VRNAPDEIGTVVRFGTAPPLPVIPEELHWRPIVLVGACHAGPVEDGEAELRPLRACGRPLAPTKPPIVSAMPTAPAYATGWWT
jgi:hypothetical protein